MEFASHSIVLQPAEPVEQKTVLVLGPTRGGTSAVAGILHALKIPMTSHPPRLDSSSSYLTYEDWPMSHAMYANNWDQIRECIERRNAQIDTWGFKWYQLVYCWRQAFCLFRNPHVVHVCRDPLAVALSWQRLNQEEFVFHDVFNAVIKHWQLQMEIFAESVPQFVVSYELLKRNPRQTVIDLCNWLQWPADEHLLADAINMVKL